MYTFLWTIEDNASGDIVTSTDISPHILLDDGLYNVTLEITDENGDTLSVTKDRYITIMEYNDDSVSPEYLKNHKCFSFGIDESYGLGWSEYAGEHWIWPASNRQIISMDLNGNEILVAYDVYDGNKYILDVGDSFELDARYLDKDQYPIETFVKTLDMTASLKSSEVTHEETSIKFNPEFGETDFQDDFKVSVGLFVGDEMVPKEVRLDIDPTKEITFYYQSSKLHDNDSNQIGVYTTTSGYRLETIESIFRRSRKFKRGTVGEIDKFEEYTLDLSAWLTRSNYAVDRITGKTMIDVVANIGGDPIYASDEYFRPFDGPDGIVESAVYINKTFTTDIFTGYGTIMFWSTADILSYNGYDATRVYYDGIWSLYYIVGDFSNEFPLIKGYHMFDIRKYDYDITTIDGFEEYLYEYYNNLERFLPQG